jgi:hypothetical protein
MAKLNEITDEIVIQVVKCAKEIFCDGIYVPSKKHLCGWDFISFECIPNKKCCILENTFEIYYITNGCYEEHKFEDKTLKEILTMTNGVYAFEKESIDWV